MSEYKYYIGLAAAALVVGVAFNANALQVNSVGIGSVGIVGPVGNLGVHGQTYPGLQLDSGPDLSQYMVFDLSSLAGQLGTNDVSSATLTISGLSSASITQGGAYELHDVSGDAAYLASIHGNMLLQEAFAKAWRDDLRDGDLYGTATLTVRQTSISILLSAAAVADINQVVDSSGSKFFAIGGFSPGLVGYNFNSSSAANVTLDVLTNTGASATPLPAALPLFAAGLAGAGMMVWRRKRKANTTAV